MNKKLLDGRTVAILVSNGFDEVEFTDPQKRLIELGATVKVVSRVKNLVNGWYEGNWGHFFPVHADVSDTLAIDFDGLIIPGGTRSVEKLFDDPHAKRILKAFLKADMPVLLIGDSVKLLIAAERVAGIALTSSFNVKEDLITSSANWVDQEVVLDKNLITGSGFSKLEELVLEFSNKVSGYDKESTEAA